VQGLGSNFKVRNATTSASPCCCPTGCFYVSISYCCYVSNSRFPKDALNEMKRKAEVVMDNVSVDKKVNEDDIRAKLNELHYGFTCSSEAEARFLVL
jgi:hypothetical protein